MVVQTENPKPSDVLGQGVDIHLSVNRSLNLICLPFFALRAGHVENDIPEALADAGFTGPLLPAIGEHPCVPKLIAASLAHAVKRLAA